MSELSNVEIGSFCSWSVTFTILLEFLHCVPLPNKWSARWPTEEVPPPQDPHNQEGSWRYKLILNKIYGRVLEEKLEAVCQVVLEGGQHLLVERQCVQLVDSWRWANIIHPLREINRCEIIGERTGNLSDSGFSIWDGRRLALPVLSQELPWPADWKSCGAGFWRKGRHRFLQLCNYFIPLLTK